MTLWVLFGLFALLVVLEVPVAFAMGLASIVTITFTQPIPLSIVVQRMGTGLDSFVLIAIPLFVLAGHLLNRAGIAEPHLRFRRRAGRPHPRRTGACERRRQHDLRRHERRRPGRCRGAGRGRSQGDARGGFRRRVRGRSERRLGDHRPDHPAVRHHGCVRRDGAGVGRRSVPRRIPAGHPDGRRADGDDLLAGAHGSCRRAAHPSRCRFRAWAAPSCVRCRHSPHRSC